MISVFLPSHNKGGFAVEAVRSVFAQDYQDWELWILENSTDDGKTRNLLRKFTDLADPRVRYEEIIVPQEIRDHYAPCPWILNQYYPRADGGIILYLSDDDLWMPGIFTAVANYLGSHPEHDAVYFPLARTLASRPGEGCRWEEYRWVIMADGPLGAGQVDCVIDGGQVGYRKKVLDRLPQPYFYTGKDESTACHADGLHLEAVARGGTVYYPLQVPGVIHRHTPASVWTRSI